MRRLFVENKYPVIHYSLGVTNLLHKSSLNRTWAKSPSHQKLLSEKVGYDTLSFGVSNLLHKSSLKMTWPITLQLQKLLSEISGCDTLSLGEGRGEATTWPCKFAYKSNLSMTKDRGEAP